MNVYSPGQIIKKYYNSCLEVAEIPQEQKLILEEGGLPSDLVGYLFRNGAGQLARHGVAYQHPFDGDGYITRLRFSEGEVGIMSRYVRTEEFKEEEQKQKMLYRSFGTNLPGGFRRNFFRTRFKNASNTSIVYHGKSLLSLWEGGLPHKINPHTLETESRFDYQGKLKNPDAGYHPFISPEYPFSAHPKVHKGTGVMHNFGTATGYKNRLVTFEILPDGHALDPKTYPMKEIPFVHDFILTAEGSQVFFLPSVSFGLLPMFLGFKTPVESLKVRSDKPTKIWVLKDHRVEEYESEFCFVFHFINGYEEEGGNLVVDALRMQSFPEAKGFWKNINQGKFQNTPAFPVRYRIRRDNKSVEASPLSEHPLELPGINPNFTGKEHRYTWGISNYPDQAHMALHGIAKVDCKERETLLRDFYPLLPGEPIFVPRPKPHAEDNGWLLVMLYDPDEEITKLAVLEAHNLQSLALYRMPQFVPLGFHGSWVSQL